MDNIIGKQGGDTKTPRSERLESFCENHGVKCSRGQSVNVGIQRQVSAKSRMRRHISYYPRLVTLSSPKASCQESWGTEKVVHVFIKCVSQRICLLSHGRHA